MMKFASCLAFAVAMTCSAAFAADNDDNRTIVVTGTPLSVTESNLKACIARHCAPDEDIKASVAHAENQFVEGDYKNARATLLASLGRNRKHKNDYPLEVSELLRANGNVAQHLGDADAYRLSVLDMRDTLKQNLDKDDARILGAELEVADSRLKLGFAEEAMDKYEAIEKTALSQGKSSIAALAKIRQLSLLVQLAQSDKQDFSYNKAIKALDAYIAAPTAGAEKFAVVAQVLKSRLDRSAGNSGSTDALIAQYAALGGTARPVLIHATPIEPNLAEVERAKGGGNTLNQMAVNSIEKRWVDVGFWITSDGKVEEPEILRNQGSTEWTKPVLQSISGRVYAPLKPGADGEQTGFYAVERYTITARWEDQVTGTRFSQRSPVTRIERLDLTN